MTPVDIGLGSVVLLLALVPVGIVGGRRAAATPLLYTAAALISLLALANALGALLQAGEPSVIVLPLGLPWLGGHFRLDAVSAFFLAVINLGGVAASIYALGYGRHEQAPHRVLPFYPAFLAAMNLVLMADDAFAFLLCWELMSLASWGLVMAHHHHHDNARAGFIYLMMASFGTLSLLLAFGLMAGAEGDYAFAAIRAAGHSPGVAALALGLALLGTGSKAGLVPVHVWLPLAHPAAPSHVSALMSGVMTKVAVYGFVRIVFDLLGTTTWWGAMVVLALGGVTAVMGVLYALVQNDLKRLLAYSSVENVGIIFIGLGLALAFRTNAMPWAAALALTAAMLHVFNHSLFKSLLFFGAGAVLTATGRRDMEELGGLIHRMPKTSFAFLVGSVAISALPPLNGFVSEWMTFQAVLLSPSLPQWGLKVLIPAVGCLLALAAALAAACFVRAFGIAFLGRPRSQAAAEAAEVDGFSLAAMFGLALLCLLAGILPGLVIDSLAPVATILVHDRMPEQLGIPWLSIVPIAASRSSYNGLLVFLFIIMSSSLAAFVIHRLASKAVRRGPAWDCGTPDADPATQYSAGGFSQPLRRVFGTFVFLARERVHMPQPGDARPAVFHVRLLDPVWSAVYGRLGRAVDLTAGRFNKFQTLTIRGYLSLVFLSLVTLLTGLAIWL
ncbi:MAG TPA: hydrogenase 4 subunit B [Rhodospirillaceae bacterium]|nr:hydrogenase 4 subunit B [Rhodospirillaceae bacterium]